MGNNYDTHRYMSSIKQATLLNLLLWDMFIYLISLESLIEKKVSMEATAENHIGFRYLYSFCTILPTTLNHLDKKIIDVM